MAFDAWLQPISSLDTQTARSFWSSRLAQSHVQEDGAAPRVGSHGADGADSLARLLGGRRRGFGRRQCARRFRTESVSGSSRRCAVVGVRERVVGRRHLPMQRELVGGRGQPRCCSPASSSQFESEATVVPRRQLSRRKCVREQWKTTRSWQGRAPKGKLERDFEGWLDFVAERSHRGSPG